MKSVLALVVLLHVCYSCRLGSDDNLTEEIRKRLGELEASHSKVNTTSGTIKVPSEKMNNNTSACRGVFVRELKHLLSNVMVKEHNKKILKELEANLNELGQCEENDQDCKMKERRSRWKIFEQYANYIRALNSSEKR